MCRRNGTVRTAHTVLVVNNETGESREFYSVTEAAKKLNVSRRLLTEYLDRSESLTDDNSACSILPGYRISRGPANKKISKTAVSIEVVNVETNESIVYPSITLAGEALGISQRAISSYFSQNQTSPYKNKYIFKKVS
jgi:predicted transcriptional regulator